MCFGRNMNETNQWCSCMYGQTYCRLWPTSSRTTGMLEWSTYNEIQHKAVIGRQQGVHRDRCSSSPNHLISDYRCLLQPEGINKVFPLLICGPWPVDPLSPASPSPLSHPQLHLTAYEQMHRYLTEDDERCWCCWYKLRCFACFKFFI